MAAHFKRELAPSLNSFQAQSNAKSEGVTFYRCCLLLQRCNYIPHGQGFTTHQGCW